METKKYLLMALVLVMISSCYSPQYLPSTKQIDISILGSFIKLTDTKGNIYAGELITVDSNQLIFLDDESKQPAIFPLKELVHFKLLYAKRKNYAPLIPLLIINPLIHGLYSIFTIPFHLLITIPVTVSGANDFIYTEKNLSFQELKMFARFPQGLPENMSLSELK